MMTNYTMSSVCAVITLLMLMTMRTVTCKQPNIVVIMADDLGWNDVSFHGSNEFMTPNIDVLGYSGIILQRHYTLPMCTPSRAAFLTGKYPVHTGMQGIPIIAGQARGIPLTEKLLPQYLKDLGYSTHLIGKWHVGCYQSLFLPTNRGFDTYFGFFNGHLDYFDGICAHKNQAGFDCRRNTSEAWREYFGHYITDLFTDEAVSIIRKHDLNSPLYLQVSHAAPHAANSNNKLQVRNIAENDMVLSHIADTNRRLYAGMVLALDDSVGKIVNALSESSLLDNSIIVFISDNGGPTVDPDWNTENYGSNWPLRGEKLSAHEGGIRTVGVVWSPLFPKGHLSSDLIHITDWLPTFYDAAGGDISTLSNIDGISQLMSLRKQGKNHQQKRSTLLVDIDQDEGSYSLIYKNWKIIKYNINGIFGFSNYFYGHSGRTVDYPEYNITAVGESLAGRKLSKYYNRTDNFHNFTALRNQATIDSLCEVVINYQTSTIELCNNKYCLFNIFDDPCETKDLSSTYTNIMQKLINMLEHQNSTVVPRTRDSFRIDPKADPKYWNNYWTPWLDESDAKFSENMAMSIPLNIHIIFVINLIYFKYLYNF